MKHLSFSTVLVFAAVCCAIFCAVPFVTAQSTAETFAKLVPAMASDDMKVREDSQLAWQSICLAAGAPGNSAKLTEVNKLMIAELDKDAPAESKYWMLQQLQWTGNAAVVPTLVKFIDSNDNRLRDRAMRALTLNPSAEAETALKQAAATATGQRGQEIQGFLKQRKQNLPPAGVESVATIQLPYISEGDFANWMKKYDTLSDEDKVRTLAALKVRKDKKYVDVALAATKSSNDDIKTAGLFALETLATAKEIPTLLGFLQTMDRNRVEWVISGIGGVGIDEAIVATMKDEKDSAKFEQLAGLAAKRAITAALPVIWERVKSTPSVNKLALLTSAEQIATVKDVPEMVEVVMLISAGRDRDTAEQIVSRVAKGDVSGVLPKVTAQNAAEYMTVIGRIGGDVAKKFVTEQLKTANKDDAVRALCNWPNAAVHEELLAIYNSSEYTSAQRLAAVRAYIRVISLKTADIGIQISPREQVAKLRTVMGATSRLEEKRLILDRTGAISHIDALRFATEFIDDSDLAQSACGAVVAVANDRNIRRGNSAFVRTVLEKVAATASNENVKNTAKRQMEDM